MATAAAMTTIDVYPHIEKTPGVCGGKACIKGTRIRVMDIVMLKEQGLRPEEMLEYYMRPLTLAQVHAALAYYYDHQDEIEASFAAAEKAAQDLQAEEAAFRARRSAG